MKLSEQFVKALPKIAAELLTRFHILYKIAKIYEPNNTMFLEQSKTLFDQVQSILKDKKEATFDIRQSAIYFNGMRLKFGFSNYHIFKFILNEFKKKEIGTFGFAPGLTEEELKQWMFLLVKKEGKKGLSFEALQEQMATSEISHIFVKKIAPFEISSSQEKNAAKIYFLSIFHLKESFEKGKEAEKIRLNTTRRLMQSIFNHIVENESFVCGLTNIKNYDEYTLNHSVNVCMLSIALGRRLGLDRSELVELGMSAFFHDLGKIETPKEILDKPSKLSEEEREIIEKHPYQGAEKLVQLQELKTLPLGAIHVALEHHVKEDLTGYPRAFKKKSINLYSKIVKIADFFDAITTKRVYRKKVFTREEALSLMLEQSGTEFHPLLLKVFVNMLGAYPIGTLVALNTGELGIIFDTNPETAFMLRPKVKIITDARGNKIDGEIVDLAEKDPQTNKYKRTIVKTLNPDTYNIQVSDYFLAQAESA